MAREPAAIRYKNPGAMWPGPIPTKWGSTKWLYLNDGTGQGGGGHGNKIAVFDTWKQGICAQLDLWRTSANYRNKRFADAIKIWSGGNHVQSYIDFVKARVPGMTEDTIMNDAFWASPNGARFLEVQAWHEAGKQMPYSAADLREAQKIVMSGKVPMTPAVKKTVTTAVAANTTTVTTAASGGMPWWGIFLMIAVGVGITVAAAWFFNRQKEIYDTEEN